MSLSKDELEKIQREFQYLEESKKNIELENLKIRNQYGMMSASPPDSDSELAKLQLDLDKQLDKTYHLLSGHKLVKIAGGGDQWIEQDDDRRKILTPYGVDQLMNLLYIYITPNTLLSNFNKEEIDVIVKNFGIEISDLLWNRAEHFFLFPSAEDLYEKYLPYIKSGQVTMTELELYKKCIEFSKEELDQKFRHYATIVWALVDLIYTTYRRAMDGQERRFLRQKQLLHISQNLSPNQNPNVRGIV